MSQARYAIFVPQVLNWAALRGDRPFGWLPFVKDKDLKVEIGYFNDKMESVATREGIPFVSQVLKASFTPSDFVDNGHLSEIGNVKFADLIVTSTKFAIPPGKL